MPVCRTAAKIGVGKSGISRACRLGIRDWKGGQVLYYSLLQLKPDGLTV